MMTKIISKIFKIISIINILILSIIKLIINKYKPSDKVYESQLIKADHLTALQILLINIRHKQDHLLHV